MTIAEVRILQYLERHPTEWINVHDLRVAACVPSAATRLAVPRLLRKGYLLEEPDDATIFPPPGGGPFDMRYIRWRTQRMRYRLHPDKQGKTPIA